MTRHTTFSVPKMDCPSEERLIRMALADEGAVRGLTFDLPGRTLLVDHEGAPEPILARLEPLGFGARLVASEERAEVAAPPPADAPSAAAEGRVLRALLAINGATFVVEGVVGLLARSTGVLADAVDMFADAAVYGVALYGVGRGVAHQRRAAGISGVLQLLLAVGVLVEVARRVWLGGEPVGPLMMAVSVVALVANVACLALLARHREGGVHMRASWIFSTNDVLANLGVIAAGALVAWTGSPWPDWIIGTLLGVVVGVGAVRILRMARG